MAGSCTQVPGRDCTICGIQGRQNDHCFLKVRYSASSYGNSDQQASGPSCCSSLPLQPFSPQLKWLLRDLKVQHFFPVSHLSFLLENILTIRIFNSTHRKIQEVIVHSQGKRSAQKRLRPFTLHNEERKNNPWVKQRILFLGYHIIRFKY